MEKELEVKNLIKKDDRIKIYKILYIGVSAYKRLLGEMHGLSESKSFLEIKTRLLNFVIKRQFESDVLAIDFPFEVEFKSLNSFSNTALFLKNNSIRLKIGKTFKPGTLHNSNKASKYMLKEATVNSKYEKQIKFLLDESNNISIGEEEYIFSILGYGIKNEEIDHLDFIIPDSNMKGIIDHYDALEEYNEMININSDDENIESTIVALKDEAKRLIK
ncbi:Uncharacterised protein [Clostridioides difficile]|uniref:hypothetical protein n=1 Tax=Clostridioides difficile TaxID=1496 RepID=UPI0010B84DF8|nr:hypothetical protein [Clostridioides difficile]MCK3712619.1 hypothetical protein [Clostridioides difficile]VHX79572.1 Uncharacterised protein [Clostridioides difficile]